MHIFNLRDSHDELFLKISYPFYNHFQTMNDSDKNAIPSLKIVTKDNNQNYLFVGYGHLDI